MHVENGPRVEQVRKRTGKPFVQAARDGYLHTGRVHGPVPLLEAKRALDAATGQ